MSSCRDDWEPVACWERRGSPGASRRRLTVQPGWRQPSPRGWGTGGLYGVRPVSSSPTSPRPVLEFCLGEASRLLPEPCSHHPPIGFTLISAEQTGGEQGTVRAVLSVLAAVVFAWAVGRGCATVESPTNRQSSPASRLMQWDGLGPPSALFPLSRVPSPVSPFHCPTDLQMTTSRRRGERCPSSVRTARLESAAPFSGGEAIPPRPFSGELEK